MPSVQVNCAGCSQPVWLSNGMAAHFAENNLSVQPRCFACVKAAIGEDDYELGEVPGQREALAALGLDIDEAARLFARAIMGGKK